MSKKAMTMIETAIVLILLIVVAALVIGAGGSRIVDGFQLIYEKIFQVQDTGREIPDTYAVCNSAKVLVVDIKSPSLNNRNTLFTYDFIPIPIAYSTDEVVFEFSDSFNSGMGADKIVTVYESTNWLTRPTGEDDWRKISNPKITISGNRMTISDLPNDYILFDFTGEPVSGNKPICKSQRQVSFEVDT
jgi:hypothetical protein